MKLKRYHIQVFCPPWSREKVLEFSQSLVDRKLIYSKHSIKKLMSFGKDKFKVSRFIKNLNISDDINLDYVFEFYCGLDNKVKKVCYRFPMAEFNYDLILVISSTGKIVTIYRNNDLDGHKTLNESIYERAGENEVQ